MLFLGAAMPTGDSPGANPEIGLVLVGGGGHALVVGEAAVAAGIPVAGYLDDAALAWIGGVDGGGDWNRGAQVVRLGELADAAPVRRRPWIIAVGQIASRTMLIELFSDVRESPGPRSVLHPAGLISRSAQIGAGTFVGPGAVVHSRAEIGAHGIINSGAIIEHDCKLGVNVHVAPGVVLGGGVRVGRDTLVGIGARVLPSVVIGAGCVIGAGAVVVEDVPDGATVVGMPARPVSARAAPTGT